MAATMWVRGVMVSGVAAAVFAIPAAAQWGPHVALGYVVNAPHQYIGVSGRILSDRWGGIGLYVDTKFDATSPRDEAGFESEMTVQQAQARGDQFIQQEESWRTLLNVALVRPVTPELMLYLGAGYTRVQYFSEYLDLSTDEDRPGVLGNYWVEEDEAEQNGANVIGGGIFRATPRIDLQFGFEAAPAGATVGANFRLPFGG